jgi:hypothetical protein
MRRPVTLGEETVGAVSTSGQLGLQSCVPPWLTITFEGGRETGSTARQNFAFSVRYYPLFTEEVNDEGPPRPVRCGQSLTWRG